MVLATNRAVAVRCQCLVSGSGSTVLRQNQGLGSTALPSRDRAVVVRTSDRVEVGSAALPSWGVVRYQRQG